MIGTTQANLRSQLGLVLAGIAGKRIAAVLLMANLSQSLSDYATFFFAEYDDAMRRLRYANCGHLSALLLRRDSTVEELESTATVLGLFETWSCSIEERQLVPGDALALYSDGITESANDKGKESGEPRLIEGLERHRELPAEALLASVVDEVRQFSSGDQQDDITLIIAKCR